MVFNFTSCWGCACVRAWLPGVGNANWMTKPQNTHEHSLLRTHEYIPYIMFGCVRSECHGCSQGVKFSIWHLRSQWMRMRTSYSATQKQSAVLWMKFRLLWTFVTYPLFVYFLYRYCLHVQIWWDVVYNLYRLWFSCIELMRHCIYYRSLTHAILWGIGVGIWRLSLRLHGRDAASINVHMESGSVAVAVTWILA